MSKLVYLKLVVYLANRQNWTIFILKPEKKIWAQGLQEVYESSLQKWA